MDDMKEEKECNPWTNVISCPLIIYVILVVIGILVHVLLLSNGFYDRQAEKNKRVNGNNGTGQLSPDVVQTITIVVLLINILFAFLIGLWIYNLCKKCQKGSAWLVFLLSLFFPVMLFAIVFYLILLVIVLLL